MTPYVPTFRIFWCYWSLVSGCCTMYSCMRLISYAMLVVFCNCDQVPFLFGSISTNLVGIKVSLSTWRGRGEEANYSCFFLLQGNFRKCFTLVLLCSLRSCLIGSMNFETFWMEVVLRVFGLCLGFNWLTLFGVFGTLISLVILI